MIKLVNSVKFIYKGILEIDEETNIQVLDYFKNSQKKTNLLHENKMLIVSNFNSNNGNYEIELKETNFSYWFYAKETKNADVRSLFSASYILTSDGYVVCELNNYYENTISFVTVNLVGGIADSKDVVNGEYLSEKCLKREFKEELGFDLNEENFKLKLKYLKYPANNENPINYNIGIIYETKTIYTKEQIQKMFKNSLHDNEVKELVFFSKEDYRKIYDYKYKKEYIPELFELVFN